MPTVEETNRFLADRSPNKRQQAIEDLLRRPEYAKFWALKWGDILRMTTTASNASPALIRDFMLPNPD